MLHVENMNFTLLQFDNNNIGSKWFQFFFFALIFQYENLLI